MKRALLVTGALWALAGCPEADQKVVDAGVPDAGPRQLTETEPNDAPDRALELSGAVQVQGTLSSEPAKPDEDWFALVSPELAMADLTLSGGPALDARLEILDVDRNLLTSVNAQDAGKPERLPNLLVKGRVLVRVMSVKKGTGGAYTLEVRLAPPEAGLELEPNDRAADAAPLPLTQPVQGLLSHPADEDWFEIALAQNGGAAAAAPPAPAPGPPPEGDAAVTAADPDAGGEGEPAVAPEEPPSIALRIEVTQVPEVALQVEVYSAAQALLFSTKADPGTPLTLRNIGVRATDAYVYVVVKSGWIGTGKEARRGFDPQARYTLQVSQEEAGANAELEPNDDPLKATALPLTGFREGFLYPKTDQDYYVLRPPQPVLVRAQLTGVERADLVLSAVRPAPPDGSAKEEVLLRSNDGALKEPEYLNSILCADACWFKVESGFRKVAGKWVRDFENPEVPYRLNVTAVPDTGIEEREPNGEPVIATPIAIGRPVRGTVYPRKDVDYYRLDLTGRMVRTPLRATLLGILKVDVGLYLHRVGEDGKLTLVQTADRAKGEAPEQVRYSAEPGMYVFEVRDAQNRESNFQDSYQLSVDEGG